MIQPLSSVYTPPVAGALSRAGDGVPGSGRVTVERLASADSPAHDRRDTPQSLSEVALPDQVIETFQQAGQFEPVLERDANRDAQPSYQAASRSFSGAEALPFSEVRAALDAWQALAPESLDRSGLSAPVTTYLEVQTGGTPKLGLSVRA